jgi:hypothetical protein
VIQLALSDDGAVLSTCAQPGMLQFHAKRDMRHVWAAWSYPAITAP